MIPTDDKTADRWLRNYPNSTIFTLLGVMMLALVIGTVFFVAMRPDAGAPTRHTQQPAPQTQSPPPQ